MDEPAAPGVITPTEVVTAFLTHGEEVLLVRRSRRVGSYRGRWSGISGYLEGKDPLGQAYTEIAEETGLGRQDVRLLARGEPLEVADRKRRWRVYPFAFAVAHPEKIRLDWENLALRWVAPGALEELETVPGLAQALARVHPWPKL